MRKRVGTASLLLAAALPVVFSNQAWAGSCDDPLVNGCLNSDTFWPHAGPQRFAGVGGTETTASGRFGFALTTAYLLSPVVIHAPSPGPFGSDRDAVDHQVNSNFLFSYGVTSRLELDLALPLTLIQDG